jgi:thymidylate synthase (FAD)
MLLVKPSFTILTPINANDILKRIEAAGRTCYKSEDKITEDSAIKFVKAILTRNHESVIEHESLSVRFICDRGVTHEIVRHRLASYSQESTRYVNYEKKGIAFVIPPWVQLDPCEVTDVRDEINTAVANGRKAEAEWLTMMAMSEHAYNYLIDQGWKPEQARSVLPNSLKTEIVMTANLREWRHFFKLRTSSAAHPQMREVAQPLLDELRSKIPVIFDNLEAK